MPKKTAEKILLGAGVVTVGVTPVGLTRGGSTFEVERGFKPIEADGDRGPVKGRILIETEEAKLSVNMLELFNKDEITKYYPGTVVSDNKWTSDLEIKVGDYNDVTWTGKTKDGKSILITIKDAINMGNISWGFEDKDETVPEIEFTATYDEDARDTPPWEVEFPVEV